MSRRSFNSKASSGGSTEDEIKRMGARRRGCTRRGRNKRASGELVETRNKGGMA